MTNENLIVTEREGQNHHHYRICWSAIFAGTFVGLGLAFLLHLYGVAISLSAFSSSPDGASVIAIGGFLGMLLGVIASMATAGFVAGYLGRFHYHHIKGGIIFGFITWSLILVMSAIMAGPVMHYVSLNTNYVSGSALTDTSKVKVTKEATSPRIQNNKNADSQAVEVTPTELAWSGWVIFALFFVGALSSCIGACCGMQCKREEMLPPTNSL
ncbi:hypothetical protein TUM19329_07780 [Legionella antarctica]|uniref:Transmembrane protein n=1 Tax=Legionella antarctica TaxID=2708020 RepID=A0A6F8T2L8_9GAMM|nr:hypothetical protein [Legionella antarctica]BCA94417.1 hypothetical protein TUM19329_07780 [Legionella antarctica]